MVLNQFFKDLKVVELASVLAGPAVGMFFAELGAQVSKVENARTGGDVTRRWKLPSEDKERDYSAYYCCVNWRKEVLLLDLQNRADQEKAYALIREADVVISNFKASSAEKIGMSYEQLKALQPTLIYAQLTAFGEGDDSPAFDIVLQAEAGFLYMNGAAEGPPVRMPVALIDILAAHQLKEAILIALLHREKTGEGSYVSTSLLDAALASLANQATNWLMAGHIPQRMGSKHPNIAPYGDIFYTKDDKAITLAVGTEQQFKSLCTALNIVEVSIDKRFLTNVLRVKNRSALQEVLVPVIRQFTNETLQTRLKTYKVPAGSIRNMEQVFQLPQAQAMILEEIGTDGGLTRRVKTVAFQRKV